MSLKGNKVFADVILPLAVKELLTYEVPELLMGSVVIGSGVVVPLGRQKWYTGIVKRLHSTTPPYKSIKQIIRVQRNEPVADSLTLTLWDWIAEYYICTLGEVIKAAIPSGFLPWSSASGESDVMEARPSRVPAGLVLAEPYSFDDSEQLLLLLHRSPRQRLTLDKFFSLCSEVPATESHRMVSRSELQLFDGVTASAISSLIKRGILTVVNYEGRVSSQENTIASLNRLTPDQTRAMDGIKADMTNKHVALLHGITSSGKTEIYFHLIKEQLEMGRQALYLVPEIALTTQLIERIKRYFGDNSLVYHSRLTSRQRREVWERVSSGKTDLVLGVRSSVFLPFKSLGLIIVDEEHDGSYKQQDPAPRYNARDTAIVLASLHKGKVVLGSATPSIESYYNASTGKYGLSELRQRHGAAVLPEIIVANSKEAIRKRSMVSHFTPELISAMDEALSAGEQIILFRNRRGFSPYVECRACGWIPTCRNCSVSLTYHRKSGRLICHYCGYSEKPGSKCGNCDNTALSTVGFGTEKIEEELRLVFPRATVERMDQDTTRGKYGHRDILNNFSIRKTDILIGTQMISKGLDFENLTVVGILHADSLLNYPDFRSYERSFQMMEQVSGRSGRRDKTGRVIIQTSDPSHPVIQMVLAHDYRLMYDSQLEERRMFGYPPFSRLIRIDMKHRDELSLDEFSERYATDLRRYFGKRVMGPEYPLVSRVQGLFVKAILIKVEKEKSLTQAKQFISDKAGDLMAMPGAGQLRINIDVDPL